MKSDLKFSLTAYTTVAFHSCAYIFMYVCKYVCIYVCAYLHYFKCAVCEYKFWYKSANNVEVSRKISTQHGHWAFTSNFSGKGLFVCFCTFLTSCLVILWGMSWLPFLFQMGLWECFSNSCISWFLDSKFMSSHSLC